MSGILKRLRNYRSDATYRVYELESSLRNAPPTFVPDLILDESTDRENLDHLDAMARGFPIGNYITYELAENALDDWFEFKDADGNVIMEDAQKELEKIHAKRALIQALTYERIFGYSYTYTGKNRYVPQTPQGGKIASIHAFEPRECVVKIYNEIGEPATMEVTVNVGQGEYTTVEQKISLPAEDFIFWNTRPIGRGYMGRSAQYAVWDLMIYLMYIYHSMAWYDMKIGNGLFVVFTKGAIPDAMKTKMDTSFEDISVRRAQVVDGSKVDRMEFVGPAAGATDFPEHVDACLNLISAGTGIPKDILTGAAAGAVTGSETNTKALFAVLSRIQTSIEPYIRELVRRMGYADEEYEISWNARFAHDEEERSKIDMNEAQTLATKSMWMSINELREQDGLPPREGGDMLKSEFQISVTGMQSPDEKKQTNNPQGRQL